MIFQAALDRVDKYASEINLEINIIKIKGVVIPFRHSNQTVQVNDKTVEVVTDFNYPCFTILPNRKASY